jgi:chorismate mutase
MNSQSHKPEERKDQVLTQLAESARILQHLSERRDMSDEAVEFEMRMQIMWLSNAANQWHKAAQETAQIQRLRELYLRREGPGE